MWSRNLFSLLIFCHVAVTFQNFLEKPIPVVDPPTELDYYAEYEQEDYEDPPEEEKDPRDDTKYALSPMYLTELARTEDIIYEQLENASREHTTSELEFGPVYFWEYEEGREGIQNPDDVVSNPLASLKMLRRMSTTLRQFLEELNHENARELLEYVRMPKINDYHDAIAGLLLLQFFYDLKAEELANGTLSSIQTDIKLSPDEVYEIALFSIENAFYSLAPDWIQLLYNFVQSDYDRYWEIEDIFELEQKLIEMHNFDFGGERPYSTYMFSDKIVSLDNLPASMKEAMMNEKTYEEPWLDGPNGVVYASQITLCNGMSLMTPEESSRLRCWLDTKRHPFFLIRPLKIEALHQDPDLLQIHDIIPDRWINEIIRAAAPKSHRAPTRETPTQTYRSAVYAWLGDYMIPNSPISRLQELIFDVHVRGNNSDPLQVASYALGAHVSMHVDYIGGVRSPPDDGSSLEEKLSKVEDESVKQVLANGDRLSTFLVYLNDVEIGGYTAFPLYKTFVRPLKGSVVYWRTSKKNGLVERRALHSACPVVYGQKWIATKWVYQSPNFLKKPCGIKSDQ